MQGRASSRTSLLGGAITEAAHRWIGIDVAKATLDVPVRATDQARSVTNDEAGIRTLLEHVRAVAPTLIVIEATGGDELAVTSALAAAAPLSW